MPSVKKVEILMRKTVGLETVLRFAVVKVLLPLLALATLVELIWVHTYFQLPICLYPWSCLLVQCPVTFSQWILGIGIYLHLSFVLIVVILTWAVHWGVEFRNQYSGLYQALVCHLATVDRQ